MRQDKALIFNLRKEGKTYREIQNLTGVTRSTLSEWFKNEEWSAHVKKSNDTKRTKVNTARLFMMNEARRVMLEKKYKDAEEKAEEEFELYKDNPLFMAGLMLYAGEGDKMSKWSIKLANSEFSLHKVFLKFIEKFTKTPPERLKVSILLYPDLNIEECKLKWSEELNIPLTNFHKPQVIKGRSVVKRLHFGVGSTIISDSFLKRKLLKWIEMSRLYLIQ